MKNLFKKVNYKHVNTLVNAAVAMMNDDLLLERDIEELEAVYELAAAGDVDGAYEVLLGCDTYVRDQAFILIENNC